MCQYIRILKSETSTLEVTFKVDALWEALPKWADLPAQKNLKHPKNSFIEETYHELPP